MASKKERLDILLVEKGICESREKAKTNIMAGLIFVDGQRIDKAGEKVKVDSEIIFKGEKLKYVSRMHGYRCINWRIYRLYASK